MKLDRLKFRTKSAPTDPKYGSHDDSSHIPDKQGQCMRLDHSEVKNLYL